MKGNLRDPALCLSLANLLWLGPWNFALDLKWNPFFFELGSHVYLFSVVLGVVTTAFLLWIALVAARPLKSLRVARTWGFVLACSVAANNIRNQVPALTTNNLQELIGTPALGAATLVLLTGIVWLTLTRRDLLVRVLMAGVLMLTPFSFFTFFQAGYAALVEAQVPAPEESRPLAHARSGPRVVVILFDEMDRDTVSLGTPSSAELFPSLTRFRNESVHFDAAVGPTGKDGDRTLISLPTITTGRRVIASDPSGPSDLRLHYADGGEGLWSQTPNLFQVARAEGVDTFLAGWFIPYCRMFAAELADCSWRPAYPPRPESVRASLRLYAPLFWISVPGLNRLALLAGWRQEDHGDLPWHEESYLAVHSRGLRGAPDARYRLVFLHYPVPHLSPSFAGSLEHNLRLADEALGDLRRAMEESNSWDASAVIVLSDHGSKALPGERHPVLMVKPANSATFRAVTRRVTLASVFNLVAGLLRGQVQTHEQVLAVVGEEE